MSRHVEYCVQCDACGKDGCHASNGHDVRIQMRLAGWVAKRVLLDGRHALVDVCASCRERDFEEAVCLAIEEVERRWRRIPLREEAKFSYADAMLAAMEATDEGRPQCPLT